MDQGVSEHSSLDHMLVSTALFDALTDVRVDHTHAPMDVSDHWPLIATFDLHRSGTAFARRTDAYPTVPWWAWATLCAAAAALLLPRVCES